jgi:hypothetical protein
MGAERMPLHFGRKSSVYRLPGLTSLMMEKNEKSEYEQVLTD